MNRRRDLVLLALAMLSMGMLGWDALQPQPDVMPSSRANDAGGTPRSGETAYVQGSPQFVHLSADRVLRPGQRLTVRGRVRDLPANALVTVSLEGPDGSMASTELRGNGSHEARFAIQHPTPAIAPGLFRWKLQLNSAGDSVALGVRVVDSIQPRVLLLLDHPSIEGSRLQRWLTQAGSTVSTRTRVSAERYRVSTSVGSTEARGPERVDALLLESVDAVVAQAAALERLSPAEQESLDLAMRRDGVGLLVFDPETATQGATNDAGPPSARPIPGEIAGGSSAGAGSGPKRPLTSPWIVRSTPSLDPSDPTRETRIRLVDGTAMDAPVSVLAAELVVPSGGQTIAMDTQSRPLVASLGHGCGRWACSLVLDSWRWRQHGHGNDYAHFWSTLLSAVARPAPHSSGEWSVGESSLLSFVDQPVSLVWLGDPDAPLPRAEVRSLEVPEETAIPLSLGREPQEPSRARSVFWPVHSGWHSVRTLPEGPTFEFDVQPSTALPAVQARRRQDADRRISETRVTEEPRDSWQARSSGLRGGLRVSAFVLFVISAAGLWSAPRRPRVGAVYG